MRVVVWDLDETLILFHSLLTSEFSKANPSCHAGEAFSLGQKWQDAILDLSDAKLFYAELEGICLSNISDIEPFDDGEELAEEDVQNNAPQELFRFPCKGVAQRIRKCCIRYLEGLETLSGDKREFDYWSSIYIDTDVAVGGWLSHARKLLRGVTEQADSDGGEQVHMVVVTLGELVPTLAKLLLFKLSEFFEPGSVYCAREVGKEQCFRKIRNIFPPSSAFAVVGDSPEEEAAARALSWPFLRIALGGGGGGSAGARPAPCDSTVSRGRRLTDVRPADVLALFGGPGRRPPGIRARDAAG
eukprot:CAMPEP_0177589212 /NCGR_PEP_ID=MMETSP0419_2-20121207/6672_1 /TAXON_ID=582737 /ORGANISM="Tetraselmis sp., Strain GSL018" /LENGTH=300 /DNA_ID=CAMNT_0019079529 /DNA_START=132 /DNA_END=1034 /DNA_ORIENTATION=-